MKTFGIEFESPIYGDANYIVEPEVPGKISGKLDLEFVGIVPFTLEGSKASKCREDLTQVTLHLGSNQFIFEPSEPAECLSGTIQLRTIVRTQTAAWFFLLKKVDAMGVPFFMVNIMGQTWKREDI